MISKRQPKKHVQNPRDDDKKKTNQVKSLWKKGGEGNMSLKTFARKLLVGTNGTNVSDVEASKRWFHNKNANTSNLPLGIGNTHKPRGAKSVKPMMENEKRR